MKFKKYKGFEAVNHSNSGEKNALALSGQDALRLRKKRMAAVRGVSLALALVVGAVALKQAADLAQENRDSSSVLVRQEVLSGTVEKASIETMLNTFGSLASAQESSLELPGSIKVTKYYVKAGDSVNAKDPIAELDRDSVMSAIAACEAGVASLDSRMAQVMEDAIAEKISASLSGQVVKIYAAKGEKVVDTMYEHGALMLVSLDKLLAIEIPNRGDLSVGDSVVVKKIDSDKSYSATVAGVKKDSLTVTVSLDEFDFEEEVEVYAGESGDSAGSSSESVSEESSSDSSSEPDQSDRLLAKGKLIIYSQQKISGYSGTVSAISVSEGDSVKAGKELMTLTDTDYTAEYFSLLSQRDELVKQYNILIGLSEDGILYADHDGIVTAIDESLLTQGTGDKLASGEESKEENLLAVVDKETASDYQYSAVTSMPTMSTMTSMPTVTSTPVTIRATTAKTISEAKTLLAEGNQNLTTAESQSGAGGNGQSGASGSSQSGASGSSQSGENGGNQEVDSKDSSQDKPEESDDTEQVTTEKTVKIEWKDEKGNSLSEESLSTIVKEWKITLMADGSEYETASFTAEEEWTHRWEELPAYNGALPISYTINCDVPEGFTASFRLSGDTMIITFAKSQALADKEKPEGETVPDQEGEEESSAEGGESETEKPANPSGSEGRTEESGSGNAENGNSETGKPGNTGTGANSAGNGSSRPSGSFGAFFGTTSNGASGGSGGSGQNTNTQGGNSGNGEGFGLDTNASSNGKALYTMTTTSLGSMIPNDEVCLEMMIDELDINKISVNQEARVTLDALPGQSFSGTISALDTSGSNSGGNTKYTARLTMEKTDQMLLGMNAAIQIPSLEKEDVLILPAEALCEMKGKTYVYLGYDEKKDELTDPVEVVTGLSDGEKVEIVEGLAEGQTYYYRYADSISYTFSR